MKRNRRVFIVWVTSIMIILLATWLLSCFLGSHSNLGQAETERIQEDVELYGILAGIIISVISLLVSVLSSRRSDRQFDTENTPTIEFASKQKIQTSYGFSALYLYDKQFAKVLLEKEYRNQKGKSEILMVMNEAGKRLFQHGSFWSIDLEFQSNTRIVDFSLNSLKLFFYVDDGKSGCVTNYLRYDEDPLGAGGHRVYRDTPFNRVLEFHPYKRMNSAKPYIKDGKYVIELMLIYQAAPIIDGYIREVMDWTKDVALKIKSELDDSKKLVIEMEYKVQNDLGYSNAVKHALFFESTGKQGTFEQVFYEIRE